MPRLALMLLVVAGASAAPASAGTFHVYGLGLNGAGCPNGWHAQSSSPTKFLQANHCSSWDIRTDGTTARNNWGGASMFTDGGARFTGFSIRSSGTTRNGMYWRVSACNGFFTDCSSYWPIGVSGGSWSDVEARLGTLAGGSLTANHLYAGLWCGEATCEDAAGARAGSISQFESHAVVEDFTAPGLPSLSGVSTGWNSGEKVLSYSATDAGSGVESVTLTVDGSLHRTLNHSCLRLPSGGYQAPLPCAKSTGGQFALNEPGQLADGSHSLTVTSRDAGGSETSATQQFLVDNNAPGHPLNLEVAGGDGWRATNDFDVTWANPDQGNGSPIAGAYYKIGSAPTTAEDGFGIEGTAAKVKVPGDGTWGVYLWLQDEAGNADPEQHTTAKLRLDTTAPTLAFKDTRDPHNPAEVRVDTADAASGVAGGLIEIRKRGVAEWRALDTRVEGTQLIATVPDEQLERGTYELQASAWDAVGNRRATGSRADGEPMVLDLPLRGDTRLSASLDRRSQGSGRALPTIRVGYGKRAWLRGVLRSGSGAPLPDTRVVIFSRPLAGGAWQPLAELVTDGNGRYALRLARGGSRELRVHFAGTRSLRPADDTAKLLVRGWAKLKLAPKRLRRGGTISFRGRVGLLGATVPPDGKLIQIQYLDGRKWRPAVKLGRTKPTGRFSIRYRFRRISRPTKIFFRILVPAEAGWPYVTGASKARKAFVRP